MALRSKLFSGEKRLQDCLTQDSAHVTPGSQGSYVQKIQTALLILDGVSVAAAELNSESYGPSTAQAVRQYKTKRAIINHSYQTTADDIVGKMTIARLDSEMVEAEAKREHTPPASPPPT
jgi:peptidoglycan hydrolase-like protein with peptidoglycan-binding domain